MGYFSELDVEIQESQKQMTAKELLAESESVSLEKSCSIEYRIQNFINVITSPDYYYSRKWRASQCSDVYEVNAYVRDPDSPTGRFGLASLPLDLALNILARFGKPNPEGSIV